MLGNCLQKLQLLELGSVGILCCMESNYVIRTMISRLHGESLIAYYNIVVCINLINAFYQKKESSFIGRKFGTWTH